MGFFSTPVIHLAALFISDFAVFLHGICKSLLNMRFINHSLKRAFYIPTGNGVCQCSCFLRLLIQPRAHCADMFQSQINMEASVGKCHRQFNCHWTKHCPSGHCSRGHRRGSGDSAGSSTACHWSRGRVQNVPCSFPFPFSPVAPSSSGVFLLSVSKHLPL